jgi:hypothetical protein
VGGAAPGCLVLQGRIDCHVWCMSEWHVSRGTSPGSGVAGEDQLPWGSTGKQRSAASNLLVLMRCSNAGLASCQRSKQVLAWRCDAHSHRLLPLLVASSPPQMHQWVPNQPNTVYKFTNHLPCLWCTIYFSPWQGGGRGGRPPSAGGSGAGGRRRAPAPRLHRYDKDKFLQANFRFLVSGEQGWGEGGWGEGE